MLEEKDEKKKNEKKFKIVKGSSKDLQISDVKDNLTFEKPEENKKNNIIIPENVDDTDDNN